MFICNDCGETFDEPKTYRENMGECWGAPAYQEFSICPYCDSEDIDEVEKCEICGQPIIDTRRERKKRAFADYCAPCEELLRGVMAETFDHLREGLWENEIIDLADGQDLAKKMINDYMEAMG